jgi:hypothetical protein
MRVQFYKPNPRVTGTACSFWTSEDGSIMSSMIKQDSWDASKRRGSFSKNKDNPAKKVIIKLNATEAGAIVDAMESNRKWSGYHQSAKQVTKINFGPYEMKGEQVGFSYGVNKEDKEDSTNKSSFIIAFNFGEAVVLREALIDSIKKSVEFTPQHKSQNFLNEPTPNRANDKKAEPQPVASGGADSLDNEDMW